MNATAEDLKNVMRDSMPSREQKKNVIPEQL